MSCTSSISTQELEDAKAGGDLGSIEKLDIKELSWDGLLIEENGDDEEIMCLSE